jgi:gamma-glutamylcyclotransferase (GGCT)/AIG2-like uncharacterized protein YtfP
MEKENSGALYAVYGTLRKGFGNYERLLNNKHCEFLGEQKTEPRFTMVSLGGFPGVIPGGEQEIVIEVFQVNNPAVEERLDMLEGYPDFYQKMEVQTNWGTANMYILDETYKRRCPVVESGDWKNR